MLIGQSIRMTQKKNFIVVNEPFVCENCGFLNNPLSGGCRNHCVKCLYSKHVDLEVPGDRASECGGLMVPVDLDKSGKKGFVLIHRCLKCDKEMRNRVADDDDFEEVIKVSKKI